MKHIYRRLFCLIFVGFFGQIYSQGCKPQINWGSSVTFCQGNSFTLNAQNPNATYHWSTGDTSAQITVSASGNYWVNVTNHCGSTADTIQVFVDPLLPPSLGVDRMFCNSGGELLSVPFSPNTTYVWQDGSLANTFTATVSGTYHVTVSNACGTFSDTVVLTAISPQPLSLGADRIVCNGDSTLLKIPNGLSGSVMWSTGATSDSVFIKNDGSYWVSVTNACGTVGDTLDITFLNHSELLQDDTLQICPGGSLQLTSPLAGNGNLWSTSATSQSISVAQPGHYWLQVSAACGTVSDTVVVIGAGNTSVNLGPDLTGCPSDSIGLDAGVVNATYNWSTGASSQTIQATSSGAYWCGVDIGCGMVYDTVLVNIAPAIDIPIDDTIFVCQNAMPAPLDAGQFGGGTNYLWSNNATGRLASNFGAGAHWVRVSNQCDTVTKNFWVESVAPVIVDCGKDTTFCGWSYTIVPAISNTKGCTFKWNNGAEDSVIHVTNSGTYILEITNECGVYTDSVKISIGKAPKSLKEDSVYKCVGDVVLLEISGNVKNANYLWNTGDTTKTISVLNAGMYWVEGRNYCDTIFDTVYVFDENPLPIDLGNDTIICEFDTLKFDFSHLKMDSIRWSDGNDNPIRNLRKDRLYWVNAYNSCGVFSDTFDLVVQDELIAIKTEQHFCNGNSVILDISNKNYDQCIWNTNDTAGQITVSQPGWYFVDRTNRCGTVRDSFEVIENQSIPPIHLGNDTLFCAGDLTLNAGHFTGANYLWQNGSIDSTFTLNSSGTYYVTVMNACNSVTDSIHVVVTGPPQLSLGTMVKFCNGSTLHLNAQNPGCTYHWNTGDTTQTLSITQPGKYWVDLANDCGSLTDTVEVAVEFPLDTIDIGQDTIICRGDSVELTTNIQGVKTKWDNGSPFASVFVNQTGDYWVEVSNSCGAWYDTVSVLVLDVPVFHFDDSTAICSDGGSAIFTAPSPNIISYQWSTGDTSSSLEISDSGVYWLTISNLCFSYSDTFYVFEEDPLPFEFGPNQTLCLGESVLLETGISGFDVIWNDGTNSASKTITETGEYWAKAENSCGIFTDTIFIQFDEPLEFEVVDTTVCRDDTAVFYINEPEFEWFDGSQERERKFVEAGDYPIKISNECGTFDKIYRVIVSHCDCPFYVPNAFTPNGDSKNETFEIGHSCDLTEFKMTVFNRWGEKVFESSDDQKSWDGTCRGEKCPNGIYTYRIHYEWPVYEILRRKTEKGMLTLMR